MADEKKKVEELETEEQINSSEEVSSSTNEFANKTQDELLKNLGESFDEYVTDKIIKNPDYVKNLSLQDMFLDFLQETEKTGKELLEVLEKKLGRKISFDDIKYLYLKANYTLFEDKTREIFKKLKERKVVKIVVDLFLSKFEKAGLELDDIREYVLNVNLNSEEDVINLFRKVKVDLEEKIKDLPKKKQEELQKITVSNEEIVSLLKDMNVLSDEEYNFLVGDIKKVSDDTKERVVNLLSVLFNSNVLNGLDEVSNKLDKFGTALEKVFELSSISKLLGQSFKFSITDIDEEDWNSLPENVKIEFTDCLKLNPSIATGCYEKVISNNFSNPSIQKIYVKLLEKNTNDKILLSIIKKLLNSDFSLSKEEKEYLLNFQKENYKENFLKVVKSFYEDLPYANKLVDEIFDFENKQITLPNGKTLELEKDIDILLDKIESITDLYNVVPNIELKLKGDNLDYLADLFSELTIDFNGKKYFTTSKLKLTTKTSDIVSGYIEDDIDEIKVYSDKEKTNLIKTLKKEEIENIEYDQIPELELVSPKEIGKLLFGLSKKANYSVQEDKLTKFADIENKNVFSEEGKEEKLDKKLDKKQQFDAFIREFNRFEGDTETKFEKGTIFSLKGNTLNFPGLRANWYHAEIVDIDKENMTFTIKPFGGVLDLEGENNEVVLPIDFKWLKDTKFDVNDYMLRFKKISNLDNFGAYIKDLSLKSDFGSFDKASRLWKNVKVDSGKLIGPNGKEVKYIGRVKDSSLNNNDKVKNSSSITDFIDAFEIEVKKNTVVLKSPYGDFQKEVDYNTFMMIYMHNELSPWSEEEFKNNELQYSTVPQEGKFNPHIKIGNFGITFRYSIGNLLFSGKEISNAVKNYFKEEDDFRAAEVYSAFTSGLGKVPLVGRLKFIEELAIDAKADQEAKIWKRITSAQSKLERADKGGNHAKVAAKIIKKEVFEPVLKGKKLSYKERLSAAGYLLYALEKGPSEYFRALADYEGQGIWVKALFGEDHYKKWKSLNDKLVEQIKKDPDNETLRNQLILSEIHYMKEIEEGTEMYSSNFGSVIEGKKNEMYSNSKVNNVYEGEMLKGNFYVIYDGLKSYILNNRPANFMGALKAISERVEDNANYVDFYKVIMMTNFTGFLYNDLHTTLKEQYEKICRSYGIPVGLFASKYKGLSKTLRIMDYIVETKGILPGGKKQTFTEYLYGESDPDNVEPLSIRQKSQRNSIISKMESFWNEYGEDVVRVFDYRDPTLFKVGEQTDEDTKVVVSEYFEKVNDSVSEDFAFAADTFKTGYSPLYKDGVFNLPKIAFSKLAWVSDGSFTGQGSMAKNIWMSVRDKLDVLKEEVDKESVYEFVLKKYFNWLGGPYKDRNNKEKLLKGLLTQDKNDLKEGILEVMREKMGHYYTHELPIEVEEGLEKFAEVFENGPESLKSKVSVLKSVGGFDDEVFVKSLLTLKEEGTISEKEYSEVISDLGVSDKQIEKIKNNLNNDYQEVYIDQLVKNEFKEFKDNEAMINTIKKTVKNMVNGKEVNLSSLVNYIKIPDLEDRLENVLEKLGVNLTKI